MSYPEYLSPNQEQEEQRRVVWSRLYSHQANLAKRLSKQKECYLALRQELNPKTTQVESSHGLLSRDSEAAVVREELRNGDGDVVRNPRLSAAVSLTCWLPLTPKSLYTAFPNRGPLSRSLLEPGVFTPGG